MTNASDGIALAAGPLLVASMTDDPAVVALAAVVQWLPPLLLGLWAGALSDRLDRRAIVVAVDLARAGLLAVLVLTLVGHLASIAVVLVALFLLACAEVFADTTTSTLTPMLVERSDLAVANSRLMAGFVTVNQLAGPPLGAALFAAGTVWPFASQVVLVTLGAVLVSRLRLPPHGRGPDRAPRLRHDIVEGIRWTVRHPAVRTLLLTITTFNVTYGAAWSVLVLYATRRLGLDEVGFGLITSVIAAGGIAGTLGYGALTRRLSLGAIMRVGLVVETLTHLVLALTTTAWVALVVFFLFGAHAFVWGTTSLTVRQRAVPSELQGRVGSVYLMGLYGGLVLGAGIGGVLAQRLGVTAPFWFAFAGSALLVVLIWGQLPHIAHTEDDRPVPA